MCREYHLEGTFVNLFVFIFICFCKGFYQKRSIHISLIIQPFLLVLSQIHPEYENLEKITRALLFSGAQVIRLGHARYTTILAADGPLICKMNILFNELSAK